MSPPASQRPKSANVGGQNPEFVLREFQGMNVLAAREAIGDNELYWCENAIPIAGGNLMPVNGAIAWSAVAGEAGPPSYTSAFNITGTDYVFAVWRNSGNAWIVNLTTTTPTQVATALFGSGKTFAVQYGNYGLLILDTNGYYDWNVTAANTLSSLNNTLTNSTLVFTNVITGGTQLKNTAIVPAGPGTGGVAQTVWTVTLVQINAAGTGYAIGDSLTLTDNNPTAPAQIIVASVGGGGAITGITLAAGGSYPGPVQGAGLTATGPTGTVVSGGSGTAATFNVKMTTLSVTLLKPGSGYSHGGTLPSYSDLISTNVAQNQFNFQTSGVIGGQAIATYAGRVWLANGRVIYFTDINAYNVFGGAGGSLTINDSYLHNNITALYSANNYLYIFGGSSIDALSNVTITNGVTFFSRVNITASIGTSSPASIFSFLRAVMFHSPSGFYLLSGASPEKVSERISGITRNILQSLAPVYGGTVLVQGELCACMLFTFQDTFTQTGAVRHLFALLFRGRWWAASLAGLDAKAMVSVPANTGPVPEGYATIYAWVNGTLYQLFNAGQTIAPWLLKTKLWDGGTPLKEKQALTSAVAGVLAGAAGTGTTVQVDTELGSSAALPVPEAGALSGYQLSPLTSPEAQGQGNSQYLGLTIAGTANTTRVALVALRGKTDRDFMQ